MKSIPTSGPGAPQPPPIVVAIGASAGGLEALKEFFSADPSNAGISYVVVTHMRRDHTSHMAELLSRAGRLPATEAVDGEQVLAGHIYVIPPGTMMSIGGGRLSIMSAAERPPSPKPIDFFMEALAIDAGPRAAGIVLSGTDHDGSLGLRAILAGGGLTLVQEPVTAQYPGMPDSAIDAGVADQVLPPHRMPAAVHDYFQSIGELEDTMEGALSAEATTSGLDDVLAVVLSRTGHDFRWYRPGMLRRRLRRRMGLHRIVSIVDYVRLLEESREEVDALKGEFLIGVTGFFRDPETWRHLSAMVLPELVSNRHPDDYPIRAWNPGCATGEESYSIAMLLLEEAGAHEDSQPVQVFGTDIDLDALSVARAGSYPESIVSIVPPERLARFFDRRGDRYVVRKRLRDAVLFAPQSLVRDTPFSRLDLVVCRNLLIYFEPALQARVLELFHFALKPDGLLVLGKAESIGAHTALFEPASQSGRIFRRVGGRTHLPRGFVGAHGGTLGNWGTPRRGTDRRATNAEILREQLAGRAAAAVLVDRGGRSLHFHGRIGQFLEPQGDAALELALLSRPELRAAIRRILRQAGSDGRPARQRALLGLGGSAHQVVIDAEPVDEWQVNGLVLVLFTLLSDDASGPWPVAQANAGTTPAERELDDNRRELALALEDAERSNDDLRLANEESLALNEELQSSNEELESSKEELQSLNEELATVNAQLEDKITELARNHDDLSNLLSSTHIATILLDGDFRIRRFTPTARALFTLQPGDEGRLLSDISSRLDDPGFESGMAEVLRTAIPAEAEVRTIAGGAVLRRILPYKSAGSRVDGVVVTFVDITYLRTAAQQARHLVSALKDSNDAVITHDLDGTLLSWNDGAQRMYGFTREEAEGTSFFALVPAPELPNIRAFLQTVRETRVAGPRDSERLSRDGRTIKVSVTATALTDDHGRVYAVLSTERDITEQLKFASEIRFRRLADDIPALLRVEDALGRSQFVNRAYVEFVGRERQDLLGDGWLESMHQGDRPGYHDAMAAAVAGRKGMEIDFRLHRRDGVYRWMRSVSVPHFDLEGVHTGFVSLTLDVEKRKQAEEALLRADQRKDEYVAMLAHELRNPLAPIRNAVAILSALPQPDARAQWATGVIDRQSEVMARLLEDLLDVSRLARGKATLTLAPLEVKVLIERAVETSRPLIDGRHHHLTLDLPDEPLFVEGDLIRLAQVVSNLLNNAAKYTDQGGHIGIVATHEDGRVAIRVRDDGVGLSAEMLPRVFDLFAQADQTLDRAHGGLGLGLALALQLVRLHHGSIEARSEGLGKGSEFIVRLPVLAIATQSAAKGHAPVPSLPSAARRVVVVDDNPDAAESLAIMLRMLGHEVWIAHDGPGALTVAETVQPDAVVLDIGLPGMNGYDVARHLRARSATAKATLVALTGYGQLEDADKARAAGFDHHLAKPASPERVDACVRSVSRRKAGSP